MEKIYYKVTHDGYEVIHVFTEDLDISELIFELTKFVSDPGYFVIEVEKTLRGKHHGEYFLNGLSQSYFLLLFEMYKDLLMNERGMIFGFCAHEGIHQVIVNAQKRIEIFTECAGPYLDLLHKCGFSLSEKNTYEQLQSTSSGNQSTIYFPNETVDEMIDALHMYGMYLNNQVV